MYVLSPLSFRLTEENRFRCRQLRRFVDIPEGFGSFRFVTSPNTELFNGRQRWRLCSQNRSIGSDGGVVPSTSLASLATKERIDTVM
jgi:hypothetical protein